MKKVSTLHIDQFREQDSPDEFYVNTIQDHLQTRHKDIFVPHKHDFYLAMLFTQGSGIHEVDFTLYDVTPGSMFFLNPGQTHHWELSDDIEGYIFFHSQAFYNLHYNYSHITQYPFFYSMHNSPMLRADGDALIKLTSLCKMLMDEYDTHEQLKKQKLLSIIDLIYIECTRLYTKAYGAAVPAESPYSVKFRQLEELVEKHYKNEKSPAHYAGMLNMTPKHLNRITQAVAGKTTGDVILNRVLLEAKKELLLQRESFAEIAYDLGYDDYAYFSRLFKKKTGDTPSAFLAKYQK